MLFLIWTYLFCFLFLQKRAKSSWKLIVLVVVILLTSALEIPTGSILSFINKRDWEVVTYTLDVDSLL
jgi:heme/copper-type cytochrome/quinol oxidase subunit 4